MDTSEDGGALEAELEVEAGAEEQTTEERARVLGWRSQEEFGGPAALWKSAEQFLADGEEKLPLLKQNNKRLTEVNRDLTRKAKRLEAMIEEARGLEERAYNRALTELQARHDAAVEEGDVKASRAVLKEMDDLRATAPEKPAPVDQDAARKELATWMDENDWYATEEPKRRYADLQAELMGPAAEWEGGQKAWLAELGSRVERKFADRKPNPVNGAGNREADARKGKGYGDLPSEAKTMAQQMERMGIMKKESYAADYWANA